MTAIEKEKYNPSLMEFAVYFELPFEEIFYLEGKAK